MKLAILQPNFFPLKSYYDLARKVDKVIFLDDSLYNNKSWVNKALIKIKSKDYYFRIPITRNESPTQIKDIRIKGNKWRRDFLKMINLGYQHFPNFSSVFPVIKEIVDLPTDRAAHISAYSIFKICSLFGAETQFAFSSIDHGNIRASMENKILDICKKENATTYYTLYHGGTLNEYKFLKAGIRISRFVSYDGRYSILDDLMTNYSYNHFFKKECNLLQDERK